MQASFCIISMRMAIDEFWVITVCSHIGLGYGAKWQRLRITLIRFPGNQTVLMAVLHLQLVFINEIPVWTELRVALCQRATHQALVDVIGGSLALRIISCRSKKLGFGLVLGQNA